MKVPKYGVNRRELDRFFKKLGGEVIPLRRTGEVQYVHPLFARRPRADGRRKDAPRHLVRFVLDVVGSVDVVAANDEKVSDD